MDDYVTLRNDSTRSNIITLECKTNKIVHHMEPWGTLDPAFGLTLKVKEDSIDLVFDSIAPYKVIKKEENKICL